MTRSAMDCNTLLVSVLFFYAKVMLRLVQIPLFNTT